MKQFISLFGVLTVACAMLCCSKPHSETITSDKVSSTVTVFATSLEDSLPKKTYESLNVGKVPGIKIVNLTGRDVRYFEYEADADVLLNALSQSLFDIRTEIADTTYRKISHDEVKILLSEIPEEERKHARSFFAPNDPAFDFYICSKSPLHHIIAVNRSTKKILHRIERIA